MEEIKEQLLAQCSRFVEGKLRTVREIISSNQIALRSETKSSAGDKHETGRAMIQLEIEKASVQFLEIKQMKEVLDRIHYQTESERAKLGSLVFTSRGIYYLSISAGILEFNGTSYLAVSLSSPIGQKMLGSVKGDLYNFNGNDIKIEKIV